VVLEVRRGEKTLSQIASERGVHPAMVVRWRQSALEGLPGIFEREEKGGDGVPRAEHERRVHELYAEIGRWSTELKWLEKSWTVWVERGGGQEAGARPAPRTASAPGRGGRR
jgi:transposase-like protein